MKLRFVPRRALVSSYYDVAIIMISSSITLWWGKENRDYFTMAESQATLHRKIPAVLLPSGARRVNFTVKINLEKSVVVSHYFSVNFDVCLCMDATDYGEANK